MRSLSSVFVAALAAFATLLVASAGADSASQPVQHAGSNAGAFSTLNGHASHASCTT